MNKRISTIQNALKKEQIDAFLITAGHSRFYISGLNSSDGVVLITQDKAYCVVDFRYFQQAKELLSDGVVQSSDFIKTISQLCAQNSVKRLGFEQDDLSVSTYSKYSAALEGISLVPFGEILKELRMVKDQSELLQIKSAQKIADDAFSHILAYIKPGVTETELAAELEYYMKKSGSSAPAFETIVLSGENSALPHGKPSLRKVQKGDNVLLDFGAIYHGYCSDITRTVCVGEPSFEYKKHYHIVLDAQKKALEIICAGISGKAVDSVARDYISSYGYGQYFGHSLGHGVGIQVHESPRFSPVSAESIPSGAVLSVEPGIYFPKKYGIRIEDLVIVRDDGCENITISPKECIIL